MSFWCGLSFYYYFLSTSLFSGTIKYSLESVISAGSRGGAWYLENIIWVVNGVVVLLGALSFSLLSLSPSFLPSLCITDHAFTLIPPIPTQHHRVLPGPPRSIVVSLFSSSEQPDGHPHQYISHLLDFYSTQKVFSELLHLVLLRKTNLQSRVCFLCIFFKTAWTWERLQDQKGLQWKVSLPFPDSQFLRASPQKSPLSLVSQVPFWAASVFTRRCHINECLYKCLFLLLFFTYRGAHTFLYLAFSLHSLSCRVFCVST